MGLYKCRIVCVFVYNTSTHDCDIYWVNIDFIFFICFLSWLFCSLNNNEAIKMIENKNKWIGVSILYIFCIQSCKVTILYVAYVHIINKRKIRNLANKVAMKVAKHNQFVYVALGAKKLCWDRIRNQLYWAEKWHIFFLYLQLQ